MHCFQCGEVLEEGDHFAFLLLRGGMRCVHSVPMIWCEPGPFVSKHVVEWVCSGAWGHTCPHQQSLGPGRVRSSKAVAER